MLNLSKKSPGEQKRVNWYTRLAGLNESKLAPDSFDSTERALDAVEPFRGGSAWRAGWLIVSVPWRARLARNYIYERTWAVRNKVDHSVLEEEAREETSAMIFPRGCDGPESVSYR